MSAFVQDDMFGGKPIVTKTPDPPASTSRRKALASTSVEAGRQRTKGTASRDRERVAAAILAAGPAGLTHHEIRDQLSADRPIELQTVCWCVGDLRTKQKLVFYPEIGWDPDRLKPILLKRGGRQVLVHEQFRSAHPPPAQSVDEAVRRSA